MFRKLLNLQSYFDVHVCFKGAFGSVICEHMPSSNNLLVLCIPCYVVCPTPTHWTSDWIQKGDQVVPVMPIGCWVECISRYQQFLSPVFSFIVHTLPGSDSAFREQHCKSDFKSHALFVAHPHNDFFRVNYNVFVLHCSTNFG